MIRTKHFVSSPSAGLDCGSAQPNSPLDGLPSVAEAQAGMPRDFSFRPVRNTHAIIAYFPCPPNLNLSPTPSRTRSGFASIRIHSRFQKNVDSRFPPLQKSRTSHLFSSKTPAIPPFPPNPTSLFSVALLILHFEFSTLNFFTSHQNVDSLGVFAKSKIPNPAHAGSKVGLSLQKNNLALCSLCGLGGFVVNSSSSHQNPRKTLDIPHFPVNPTSISHQNVDSPLPPFSQLVPVQNSLDCPQNVDFPPDGPQKFQKKPLMSHIVGYRKFFPDPSLTSPAQKEPGKNVDFRCTPQRAEFHKAHFLSIFDTFPPLAHSGMMAETVVVNEIYLSVQGESTFAGLPCVFVRLTACNLRCSYCDTAYAFKEGQKMELGEVLARLRELAGPYEGAPGAETGPTERTAGAHRLPLVEFTGGEPLLQKGALPLIASLCDEGFTVLVETSGALDISEVDARVRRIMDLKCPSSGESGRNRFENIRHLKSTDEVKFVIGTVEDYEWAKAQIERFRLEKICPILFSWVSPLLEHQRDKSLKAAPEGQHPLTRVELVERIVADALPVRFQLQMHKFIWPPDERGV
jgi:7-carboxy-7-deazaguanine synthase